MLETYRHRRELRQLQKRRRQIEDKQKDAYDKKDHILLNNCNQELKPLLEEIRCLQSWFWIGKADHYSMIEMIINRDENRKWTTGEVTGKTYLTPQALTALRSAVRAEEKERRDEWLPYLSLSLSVVALCVSLLSLIIKSH